MRHAISAQRTTVKDATRIQNVPLHIGSQTLKTPLMPYRQARQYSAPIH